MRPRRARVPKKPEGPRRQMKITEIAIERLRLPLDPPFHPAWTRNDDASWHGFEAVLVRVHTDE